METKTAGILVDNYKLEKFKEVLSKSNFTIISVSPFNDNISTIRVELVESRIQELTKLCKLLEFNFQHKN